MSHFARSSLIVAVFFGIDKVLAFVRQLIVARQFSLSYELDVFNAANNIPDLLSALISGGALGVALIPVLSEYLERKDRSSAWDLFVRIVNLAFVVTAIISVVLAVFAPWFVDVVVAPGFPEVHKELTVDLLRYDLIAIIIFSISGLAMAGLHANQHFLLPAAAPVLYNVGQIFGALILAPEVGFRVGPIVLPAFNMGIHGLVFGVILGATMHLLIQVPGLMYYGFQWRPVINLRHRGVRQVLVLFGPRILTMFFIQTFFIVRDNLASSMGEGAVTALNIGWFIMQVPETLVGTAIAIVILPTLSEQIARGESNLFRNTINSAIRIMLAVTIPAASLLAIGIRPLVQAAFNFDPIGTEMVVFATRAYLLGLVGHALLEIASRSFYAKQNALTPLIAAALNACGYIVIALVLSNMHGYIGIAIANSVIFTSEAFLLLWWLRRSYPGILKVRRTIIRVGTVTGVSAIIVNLVMLYSPLSPLLSSIIGLILGLLLVLIFIRPEIYLLLRLGRTKPQTSNPAAENKISTK
jgi:putative peptidoglycan lipid II flippase